mgnify:CR=1 FL=1
MLFDSHAHLNDARFNIDRRYVLNALEKNGVGAVICAGYDIESSEFALKIANENKNLMKQEIVPQGAYLLLFCAARLLLLPFKFC